jgi:hypothetical protein
LFSGFGSPPVLAATVMIRDSLLKSFDRFASTAALRCFVVAHLECPDIRCLSFFVHGNAVGRETGRHRREVLPEQDSE